MNSFLSKISQLDSILDVILLSHRGEPLFVAYPQNGKSNSAIASCWHEILSNLDYPKTLDAVYSQGRYYLTRSEIGHLIIAMRSDKDLHRIRQACDSTFHKLTSASLRKKVLLKMLTDSHDTIKPHIIKELIPVADGEVAAVLIRLLQKEATFDPAVREKLQLFICQALGHCNAYEAIVPLNTFLAHHKSDPHAFLNVEIREAASLSIQQLETSAPKQPRTVPPVLTPKPAPAKAAPETKTHSSPPRPASKVTPKDQPPPINDIPQADTIAKLVDAGKKEEALNLIMELIEENARKKDFSTADKLRKRLMQIDSMALSMIIRAAELIDEEKMASINKDHLKVWKDLVELLSEDEFASLYHKMTLKTFQQGEIIATQGRILNTLMFINSGRVQIQATNQNSTIPLKIKEAGEIIGGSSFFEASVWTVNAKSLGAELFLLSKKDLNELTQDHPSLQSKLSHFCAHFEATSALLKKIRKNRRQFERKKIMGRLSFAILDREGNETGIVAKGDLIDISRGGIAFSIHSSQKRNAVNLFGRRLRVSINAGASVGLLTRNGIVRAVKDQDLIGNDYSIHIKFDKTLTSAEMQQALSAAGAA